jgi:hypothetical protein
MNFTGVIEFTKYTLALAAACFVYTLETFVPAEYLLQRWLILALLAVFFVSSLAGTLVMAVSTKALHGAAGPKPRAEGYIETFGVAHSALLVVGMLGLAVMLVPRVLREPAPPSVPIVQCAPAATEPVQP